MPARARATKERVNAHAQQEEWTFNYMVSSRNNVLNSRTSRADLSGLLKLLLLRIAGINRKVRFRLPRLTEENIGMVGSPSKDALTGRLFARRPMVGAFTRHRQRLQTSIDVPKQETGRPA
jgi:hypothetical protein